MSGSVRGGGRVIGIPTATLSGNRRVRCEKCQKHIVTIIACIIDTLVIHKILAHLDKTYSVSAQAQLLPPLRDPPNDFSIQRDFDFGAQAINSTRY